MPFGSDSTSKVEILRCPGCREFIASDATRCRFCRRPLDPSAIKSGVAATQVENRKYRRSHFLKHMLTGFGVFAVSALLTFGTFWAAVSSESGGYYVVVSWGFMIGGLGDFIYGLYGYLGEVLSKK